MGRKINGGALTPVVLFDGDGNAFDADNPLSSLSVGKVIALLPSAARTAIAAGYGTAFAIQERVILGILLEFTNKANDANDTCDVYIDMLIGGTWVNAVHFTQALGSGTDVSKEYALLMPTSGLTTPTNVTSDAGSGVVRPEVMGSQIRVRWAIVDPAGANATFTFSVTAWVN